MFKSIEGDAIPTGEDKLQGTWHIMVITAACK